MEAVTCGDIKRLLINLPPRHMKSLMVSVLWPAWTWGPCNRPDARFVFASYALSLSMRDSVKCRRVLASRWYRNAWGDRFALTGDQNTKTRFENDKRGYRMATSVDGALTGEGGDVIVVDDPHDVREVESDTVRESTLTSWDEAMSTRLNDPRTGAYVVIMQRMHERDLTGHILSRGHDWTHLCLPARYEPDHPHVWAKDVRRAPDARRAQGVLLWPSGSASVRSRSSNARWAATPRPDSCNNGPRAVAVHVSKTLVLNCKCHTENCSAGTLLGFGRDRRGRRR